MLAVVWFDVSPTLAVAVGAGAGMTAGTRLVFSSLLLGSLLVGTGGLDALPAAVIAVAAAWITTAFWWAARRQNGIFRGQLAKVRPDPCAERGRIRAWRTCCPGGPRPPPSPGS